MIVMGVSKPIGWGSTLAWRYLKMPHRHNYSVQGASVGRILYSVAGSTKKEELE